MGLIYIKKKDEEDEDENDREGRKEGRGIEVKILEV